MSTTHAHQHGPASVIAENGLGHVSVCDCGVMTLTVACVSMRFEPSAFAELAQLIGAAHRRSGLHAPAMCDVVEAPAGEAISVH